MVDLDRRILAALDQAPATVVVLQGSELRYAYFNDLFRRLMPNVRTGELFGFQTEQAPEFRRLAERVLKSGEPVRLSEVAVDLHPEGRAWMDVLMHPTRNDAGEVDGVIIVGTDVTGVVEARRALQAHAERARVAEARLSTLLERGPFVIFSFDASGRILFTAGGQLQKLGRKPGDMVGLNAWEVYRDEPQVLANLRRAFAGEAFTALLSRPGGLTYEIFFSPLRDAAGAVDQVTAIAIDVTARRRAEDERARIQEKMQQTQKLESLGVLAGGIAHDFNNLLTVIHGNASLALRKVAAQDPARVLIQDIVTAAERASDLTRQMLAYSGQGRFEVRPLDLRRSVREIANLMRTSIPKKVLLRIDEPSFLSAVQGDPSQLQQVLMNLVLNAAEAVGERGGEVTVSLSEEEVGADGGGDLVGRERLPEGRYVRLTVRDTGSGMDPQIRARIFDPFFTTKSAGRGLGLAAVLGIVRGHGGAMRIQSAPGRGTVFDVLLPAAGALAAPAPGPEAPAAPGRGTILIIDDEISVRTATARMLASLGYDVLEAQDGEQGVEIFRLRKGDVDAVVLDLTMPHLSGEETLHLLRGVDPGVRVVFFSGYAEDEIAARLGPLSPAAVLHKPFTRPQLAAAIQAALAAEP